MQSRFEAMFEQVGQGVFLADADTRRVVRANGHFVELSGRASGDVTSMTLDDLVDPDDMFDSRNELARLHEGSIDSFDADWAYVQPDGSLVESHTVVMLVRDTPEAAPLFVMVVEDQTRQKALEERLLLSSQVNGAVIEGSTQYRETMEELVRQRTIDLVRARDEAQSADRAKSAFLATVSHELRTPLNAIIGFSSLLLEMPCTPGNSEQRKQLSIIRESGTQLLERISEILDIASVEAGRLVLQIGPVDLRSVIDEQVSFAQAQAGARHLKLSTECADGIVVSGDLRRLGQVVRNLLSNALKFTDHGHVVVRVAVTGDLARIEVEDTGIGISPARHSELFVSFQRIQEGGTTLRPGTGLGLAISRRLVEAMGGDIGFDSEPGVGSRFWFRLPIAHVPDADPLAAPSI